MYIWTAHGNREFIIPFSLTTFFHIQLHHCGENPSFSVFCGEKAISPFQNLTLKMPR
jgi:hypothetical protein